MIKPDGQRIVGLVLATRLKESNQKYLLVVTVEAIGTIATHTDLNVWLIGGFDPPSIALDHSRPMSFLLMMYPEVRDVKELVRSVGSIDR
jgi:hypothetical protein